MAFSAPASVLADNGGLRVKTKLSQGESKHKSLPKTSLHRLSVLSAITGFVILLLSLRFYNSDGLEFSISHGTWIGFIIVVTSAFGIRVAGAELRNRIQTACCLMANGLVFAVLSPFLITVCVRALKSTDPPLSRDTLLMVFEIAIPILCAIQLINSLCCAAYISASVLFRQSDKKLISI